MPQGRKLPPVILSEAEREVLQGWVRRSTTAQALAMRARIVLECAQARLNMDVADRQSVARPTVGRWRRLFCAHRQEAQVQRLSEPPPPRGRPAAVDHAPQTGSEALHVDEDRERDPRVDRSAM